MVGAPKNGKGAPAGNPDVGWNIGLTPQQSIVNADGTPTGFFFRWLLSWRRGAVAGEESGISVNGVLAGSVTTGPISVNGTPLS